MDEDRKPLFFLKKEDLRVLTGLYLTLTITELTQYHYEKKDGQTQSAHPIKIDL